MNTRAAAIRLMARVLANSSRKLFDAFAFPRVRGSDSITPTSTTASMPAISHNAGRKPANCSRKPPMKKPAPLVAFFDPVNQATQRNNCPMSWVDEALIALFDEVLVSSLATPATPCASTTQTTDIAAPQLRRLQELSRAFEHDVAAEIAPGDRIGRCGGAEAETAVADVDGTIVPRRRTSRATGRGCCRIPAGARWPPLPPSVR